MRKFHRGSNPYVERVHLKVMNIETSLEYYEQIIGLRIKEKFERIVHLTADGETVLLTLEQPEGVTLKQPRTTGIYHVAFLLPSRTEFARFLQHIRDERIDYGASDHEVSEAIYLRDPDGNGIEVYRDRLPEEWGWKGEEVVMRTDPLREMDVLEEADGTWRQMPQETVIGHVHLHVRDLEKTQLFYEKGLGFNLMTQYPGALFMATGGYHHHFGLNIWNGEGAPAPKETSAGLKMCDVLYPNETDLEQVIAQLKSLQFSVEQVDGAYVVRDPSENTLCLKSA